MTSPVNILLVDDKPENLLSLEELLRQPDRHIVKAASGNEALLILLKHDFAVVVLDVQMPEMDGYETAQLMRSGERSRGVPILFVTAGDRSEEKTFRGYEVGAVDFLYKPINARILKSKVDVFVELYRKTQALEALNAELERTSAALRERLADLEGVNRTLSHDLRAPLRSIQSFSAILAESLAGKLDPESDDHLARIVRASQRMARMVDDLYRLLRLSALEESLADIDSGALLREVLEGLQSDVTETGATITCDSLPTIRANATLLAQVLQNLIANALKFRGEAPARIHVCAERVAGAWRFAVKDHGVGIHPAFQERLFGIFQRQGGDAAGGSGIGLALCKRAVEKHGGRIWAESAPGQGSTFYFTLPA